MFEGWAAAGAVIGSAVIGGAISASGAQSAAQTQANAAENAQQISLQEFNTITGQETPYMQSGYGALSALDWGLGITPQTATGQLPGQSASPVTVPNSAVTGGASQPGLYAFPGQSPIAGLAQYLPNANQSPAVPASAGTGVSGGSVPLSSTALQSGGLGFGSLTKSFDTNDWKQLSPAYNFQLQQGQQGVLNTDASGQGALSGSAMKDLINYNQAEANTSFNNAFNQYQTQQGNIFSRLSGIAQLGQSAAANTGQQGTALAGQAAQSATNVGSALAAGQVGAANAISGGISNASSAIPWLYMANSGGG